MLIMEENNVFSLVCKVLIEKFAYSLEVDNDYDGNKQMLINFRNCYDITPLMEECEHVGLEIKEGALGVVLNDAKSALRKNSVELLSLDFSMAENEFFVGERLRLKLLSRAIVDLVKVESGRWWVMHATNNSASLCGLFVSINDSIGPNRVITVEGKELRIEFVFFLVSNKMSRLVDRVMCPGFYHHKLDDSSLEEILIVPAYKMAESLSYDPELKFNKWMDYLNTAHKYSFDSSTAWNIANAVINNYHILYR